MTVPQCEGNRGEGELKHLLEVEGDQTISMKNLARTLSQRTPKWGAIEIFSHSGFFGVRSVGPVGEFLDNCISSLHFVSKTIRDAPEDSPIKKWAPCLSFSKRNFPKSLSTLSLSLSHIIFSEALFVDHICRSNGLPPQKIKVLSLCSTLAWSLSSNLVYFHLTFLSRKWSQILVGCDWKKRKAQRLKVDMGVSENRCGTPKSFILIGFSIIKFIHFGYPYFWKHPYLSR